MAVLTHRGWGSLRVPAGAREPAVERGKRIGMAAQRPAQAVGDEFGQALAFARGGQAHLDRQLVG
ncbi:MAG: hypothetical protein B7Y95_14220 [Rhizobiales bacterium 32-66-11]|nr:MAG: hypothetical protein B7Y95_14220 [Rhizobiales bacterium 32-66-11]